MLKPTATERLFNPRWIGPIYAGFASALLLLAVVQQPALVAQLPLAQALFALLLAAALATGALIVQGREGRWRRLALPLLLVDAAAGLGLVALTGGAASPLWVALLVVSTAAPLLLGGRTTMLLLAGVWLLDGLFLLALPPGAGLEPLAAWAVRAAGVLMIGLLVQRALAAEEALRRRAQRRERVLREFLIVSNRLRVTSEAREILDEVARAVQASGEYDCVTLCRVDAPADRVTVELAVGASGRRLRALEGLSVPWADVAPLLAERRRVGAGAFRSTELPFRSIRGEEHLLFPLNGQYADTSGLLTVSYPVGRGEALAESLPLLELLANQAAAALDNSALFATLEERVRRASDEAAHGKAELAQARDRAETLFQIARSLAGSLDEREVLTRGLSLLMQATGAARGGVMLAEPTSGRLAFRTTLDAATGGPAAGLERGQELAGWVLATRQATCVPDTRQETRWQRHEGETARAVLAVPLLLDAEPTGVILLAHGEAGHFDGEHEHLALAAANQIAIALAKAQLYRYVAEQRERLGVTLRQREEEISRVRAILRSIGDGVVVCDRLGRVRLMNPAAERLLGTTLAQVAGRPLAGLPGAPGDAAREGAGETQQVQVGERTLRAFHAPVHSSTGEWLGSVVVYHDVTREALADRLKSEFIATASHELRTPLTSVRGYVDLLLLGTLGPLSPAQADFLKIVKNNIVRLVEQIDDLLDISKLESGEVRLRREQVDVGVLLHEVAESLYAQFAERAISLALDVPPDAPPVMADRRRLRQIALNLLSNACKYTPSGGRVDVVLRNGGDELRVDVRDTGVGIAPGAQPFIFTRYFRADNPLRETAGGSGLGLNITRTLVELHGGRIWFESAEGVGTTFSFTLPLHGEWEPAEWLSG